MGENASIEGISLKFSERCGYSLLLQLLIFKGYQSEGALNYGHILA